MNKVLPWVKSNWLIVLCCVLIVAILPTAIVISSGMNKDLRETLQKRVDEDAREVGKVNLTYEIPSPIPGVKDVSHTAVANAAMIEWFKARREEIQAEAGEVWTRALAFNKGDHAALMDGIFPAPPAGSDDRVIRNDFTRLIVEKVPADLLTAMNAGPGPDNQALATILHEQALRRNEQMIAQRGAGDLNPEEIAIIAKELAQIRMEHYSRRAAEVSVYADRASFPDVPPSMPLSPPLLGYCWEWQEAVWALNDFAAAVATANARTGDRAPGVPGSVVKRLIRVKVNEPEVPTSEGSEGGRRSRGDSATPGMVSLDPAVSLTGRVSGADTDNKLYDVRHIEAEMIVSTRHLPHFLNALASTNFMTILDLDLERVEPLAHLAQGYYYGEDHVVKATVVIESLWLREWVAPLTPPEVRRTRGIEDPTPAGGEADPGQG